jgi:hypothetical protein
MTEQTTVREKKPYAVDQGKIIPGKQTCDRCSKKSPPIYECSWPISPGSAGLYYMDLCTLCFEAISAHISKGMAIGPYGQLDVSQSEAALREKKLLADDYTPSVPTYGPRPRNGGFQCRDCKTEEYPLFGRGGKLYDKTYCEKCLRKRYPTGFDRGRATPDARNAMKVKLTDV